MKINPNLATVDELQQLKGIGPSLAERIISGRPYALIRDLEHVSGIGPSTVLQWQDQLTLDTVQDEQQEAQALPVYEPSPEADAITQEIKTEPMVEMMSTPSATIPSQTAIEPVVRSDALAIIDEIPPKAKAAEPAKRTRKPSFTRGQSWLLTIAACVVTAVLVAGAVLGAVAWLNDGRLRFAAPERVEALSAALTDVESRLTVQETELESLTARVDNLETLDDRMLAAEENIDTLNEELDNTAQQLETLDTEVGVLQDDVSALQSQSETFTTFFESLRDMLLDLFPYLP
jgi:hypothetical protein